MHPDLILARTESGELALKGKGHQLKQRHKTALWLIDGVKTVAEIQLVAGEDRTEEAWYELLMLGYLQPLSEVMEQCLDFTGVQHRLICITVCVLNGNARATCAIIRNMKNDIHGLLEALRKIERLVRMTIDEGLALELGKRFRILAPVLCELYTTGPKR